MCGLPIETKRCSGPGASPIGRVLRSGERRGAHRHGDPAVAEHAGTAEAGVGVDRERVASEPLGGPGDGDAGAVARDLGDGAVEVPDAHRDVGVSRRPELEHAVGAEPGRRVAEDAGAGGVQRERECVPLDEQEVIAERRPLREAHGRG